MLKEIEKPASELTSAEREPGVGAVGVAGAAAVAGRDRAAARRGLAVLAGLLVAVLLFHAYTLLRFPSAFVDEGWNAARSWALLHTGRPFGTLDSGVFENYPGYWTYFPLLASAIHAVSLAVLGPSLLAMRLVSFVFGAALLIVVYITGARLGGTRTGLLSVLLLSISIPFLFTSHIARHDIIVAALG